MQTKPVEYEFMDLAKVCLAFMVVAIHSRLSVSIGGANILFPWLRIAVPLFFIMSGFFFFKGKGDGRSVYKFLCRNYGVYLFYTIIFLPMLAYTHFRDFFQCGPAHGVMNVLLTMFFIGDGFAAAWFIIALIYGVVTVWALSRLFGTYVALILGAAAYIITCMSCTYGLLRIRMPVAPCYSFLVAIVFVAMGKLFADGWRVKREWSVLGCFISGTFLVLEWALIYVRSGWQNEDCLVALIPFCFFAFSLLLTYELHVPCAKDLRRISQALYFLHFSIIILIRGFVKSFKFDCPPALCMFLLAVTGALALGLILYPLQVKFSQWFVRVLAPGDVG